MGYVELGCEILISFDPSKRRLLLIAGAAIVSVVVLFLAFWPSSESNQTKRVVSTTTTTLPPIDAQACEYLTEEALLAGGIIADVEPKSENNLRRCTFLDIGGSINYITLFVDNRKICEVLIEDFTESEPLKIVAPEAIYSEEPDPTIIVPQGDRCFFLQGSNTIVTKVTLTEIAKNIAELFLDIDATTTTVPPETVVVPEDTSVVPGVNRAPSSLAEVIE